MIQARGQDARVTCRREGPATGGAPSGVASHAVASQVCRTLTGPRWRQQPPVRAPQRGADNAVTLIETPLGVECRGAAVQRNDALSLPRVVACDGTHVRLERLPCAADL